MHTKQMCKSTTLNFKKSLKNHRNNNKYKRGEGEQDVK